MGEESQSVTEMPCIQWVGQTSSEIRGTLLRALSHRSPLTHHSHTHPRRMSLSLSAESTPCAYQCKPGRGSTNALCLKLPLGQGLVAVSHGFRVQSMSPMHGFGIKDDLLTEYSAVFVEAGALPTHRDRAQSGQWLIAIDDSTRCHRTRARCTRKRLLAHNQFHRYVRDP